MYENSENGINSPHLETINETKRNTFPPGAIVLEAASKG